MAQKLHETWNTGGKNKVEQVTVDLLAFTEEILNEKLHFFSVRCEQVAVKSEILTSQKSLMEDFTFSEHMNKITFF